MKINKQNQNQCFYYCDDQVDCLLKKAIKNLLTGNVKNYE